MSPRTTQPDRVALFLSICIFLLALLVVWLEYRPGGEQDIRVQKCTDMLRGKGAAK